MQEYIVILYSFMDISANNDHLCIKKIFVWLGFIRTVHTLTNIIKVIVTMILSIYYKFIIYGLYRFVHEESSMALECSLDRPNYYNGSRNFLFFFFNKWMTKLTS